MSFFTLGASERIGKENRLLKLNELLDWEGIRKYLMGFHPSEGYNGPLKTDDQDGFIEKVPVTPANQSMSCNSKPWRWVLRQKESRRTKAPLLLKTAGN
jgi:hypothetical protein